MFIVVGFTGGLRQGVKTANTLEFAKDAANFFFHNYSGLTQVFITDTEAGKVYKMERLAPPISFSQI